jgi:hypothetical protein
MSGLPSPELLSLSEAVALVVKRCSCSEAQARRALRDAGRNRRLDAKGSVPLSAHGNMIKREAHPHRRDEGLRSGDWSSEIDWDLGKIGPYSDVRITRISIETWLSGVGGVETSDLQGAFKIADEAKSPPPTAMNTSAVGPDKASAFRSELEAEYKALQSKSLEEKGRGTTVSEDESWRKDRNITRMRLRELRRTCRPPEYRKGGAPTKRRSASSAQKPGQK